MRALRGVRSWLVIVAVLAAGCERKASDLIEAARLHQERGDVAAAIRDLRQVAGTDPRNGETRLLLAHLYAAAGEAPDAEKEFRQALELGVPAERVLPPLAAMLNEMQKFRAVLGELAVPDSFETQALAELTLHKARAHLGLGALAEARTQFLIAGNYRPIEAKLGLAEVAIADGDVAAAAALVDEVIGGRPDFTEAWLVRGDLHRIAGDPARASEAYREAIKLAPRNVIALASEAAVKMQAGDYAAARDLVGQAHRFAPGSAVVNFSRAVLALHEGRHAACREALERVLAVIPQHAPATLLSAMLHFATNDLEQAQRALSAYLGRFPADVHARKLLGATLLRHGQPVRAAAALAPVLAADTQDAELLALAGRAQLESGQPVRGIEYLERAVARVPGSARYRTELGLARLSRGDERGALVDLATAAGLDPADFQADLFLIGALIASGEPAAALAAVNALEARHPKLPVAQQLRGAIHLSTNDRAPARAAFESALRLDPAYFPAIGALARLDREEGNAAGARVRLEAFLARDEASLEANLAMAELDVSTGRDADALIRLARVHAQYPQSLSAALALAQQQLRVRRFDAALATAQRAWSLDARDPEVFETLARAQLATGDPIAAADTLIRLAALFPNAASPQVLLAEAYFARGDLKRATAALRKAVALEPDSLAAGRALGLLLLEAREWQEARAWAGQLQRRHADRAHGHVLEGDALMAQGDAAGAAAAFDRALAIEDSAALRVRAHQARSAAAGTFAPAGALLAWLQQHPDDAVTRRYLASAYLSAAKGREAAEHYQMLLKANPRDAIMLNNLAWALQLSGDARALDVAQQAFSEDRDGAAPADTLGWILLQQGQAAEGLRFLTRALAQAPDNPLVRFHRAQALVKVGETGEARAELARVLQSGVGFPHAEEARALLARLGS